MNSFRLVRKIKGGYWLKHLHPAMGEKWVQVKLDHYLMSGGYMMVVDRENCTI